MYTSLDFLMRTEKIEQSIDRVFSKALHWIHATKVIFKLLYEDFVR